MPDSDHRLSRCCGLAALVAAACIGAAAPAAAEQARAQLSVQAVVLPACRASAAPDGASLSCSGESGANVTVERRVAAPPRDGPGESPAGTAEGVTVVTVTY